MPLLWPLLGIGLVVGATLAFMARGKRKIRVARGPGTAAIAASLERALRAKNWTSVANWADEIALAFEETDVDPFLISAIMERESGGGRHLNPQGDPRGVGDPGTRGGRLPPIDPQTGQRGWGKGLMQIDIVTGPAFTKGLDLGDALTNIVAGARVIKEKRAQLARLVPNWSSLDAFDRTRAILAAYNTGASNVARSLAMGRNVDSTTTKKDYSRDVLVKAQELAGRAVRA